MWTLEAPKRPVDVDADLALLVLAASPLGLVAVDLGSGAVVRSPAGVLAGRPARPFDVLAGTLDQPGPFDPLQPEAVDLVDAVPAGRLHPRRAERWLRSVAHPRGQLLGFAGPAVPFWLLDGSRPSAAVVEAPAELGVDHEGLLRCRFRWLGLVHDLPAALGHGSAPPGTSTRLVVALTPPVEGHCYKVVVGLI